MALSMVRTNLRSPRIAVLVVLVVAVLAAWVWATSPRAPSSSIVGVPAEVKTQEHGRAAYQRFVARLKTLAGQNAKECGALALRDTKSAVLACGIEGLSKSTPFWLAIEFPRRGLSDLDRFSARRERGRVSC
jgi:hypothetical protein